MKLTGVNLGQYTLQDVQAVTKENHKKIQELLNQLSSTPVNAADPKAVASSQVNTRVELDKLYVTIKNAIEDNKNSLSPKLALQLGDVLQRFARTEYEKDDTDDEVTRQIYLAALSMHLYALKLVDQPMDIRGLETLEQVKTKCGSHETTPFPRLNSAIQKILLELDPVALFDTGTKAELTADEWVSIAISIRYLSACCGRVKAEDMASEKLDETSWFQRQGKFMDLHQCITVSEFNRTANPKIGEEGYGLCYNDLPGYYNSGIKAAESQKDEEAASEYRKKWEENWKITEKLANNDPSKLAMICNKRAISETNLDKRLELLEKALEHDHNIPLEAKTLVLHYSRYTGYGKTLFEIGLRDSDREKVKKGVEWMKYASDGTTAMVKAGVAMHPNMPVILKNHFVCSTLLGIVQNAAFSQEDMLKRAQETLKIIGLSIHDQTLTALREKN